MKESPGRSKSLGAQYWKLWSSSAVSDLGDGVVLVALPLLAVQLTASPGLIAGVTVAVRLPWLLFSLHAGALADRVDRRRLMIAAHVLRVAVLIPFAVAISRGVATIWALYAVTFLLGAAEVAFVAAARPVTPMVVERRQLTRANGHIYAAKTTMNEFVGPPLGGVLIALSVVMPFAASSGTYIVAATALLLMGGRYHSGSEARGMHVEIAEGLKFLWSNRLLRTLSLMVAVMAGGHAAWMAVLVLYAVGPMGLSEAGYGALLTAGAAGALAGSQLAEPLQARLGRAKLLTLNVIGTAAMFATPALTANPWIVGAAGVVGGCTGVMWSVVTVSLTQTIVPGRLLGRVSAAARLVGWGTLPVGAAVAAVIGETLGVRAVFALAGLSSALLLIARRVISEDAITTAEESHSMRHAAALTPSHR